MKKYFIYIFCTLFIFYSCKENNDNSITVPIDPPTPGYHKDQKLSYDGENIVFSSSYYSPVFKILNLKTGELKLIDISNELPSNVHLLGTGPFHWRPYVNNKLLFRASTSTDTAGDGEKYNYGINLYIFSIDNFNLECITPAILGDLGANGMKVYAWLPESNNDQDLIQISFNGDTKSGQFIYIPQEDELQDYHIKNILSFTNEKTDFFPREYYSFSLDYSNNYEKIYSFDEYHDFYPINRYKCKFDVNYYIVNSSFSPDGKYLALSVDPDIGGEEIWIVDLEEFLIDKPYILNPKKITSIKNSELKLFGYVWAEFITNTTMAVTLFKSGDDFAYIYEITIDGKIVRQLTFEP